MPNTREKLIELLEEAEGLVNNDVPSLEQIADYLIAYGVTFATDNNVGDKLSPTEKWIPVTERLPEDSTYVLARLSGGAIYQALCLTKGSKQWYAANLERFVNKDTVTHWMPLPEPPKGE